MESANQVWVVEFAREYLALFFTFVAVFYTARILTVKKQLSQDVVFAGARFCATWWNHIIFRVFRATIWMLCVARAIMPEVDGYLGFIAPLQQPVIIWVGLVLLTAGTVATMMIHFYMGPLWRSGIDPRGPRDLITHGIYAYSRHPMFVCVLISQLGFFLSLPSVFSLVCLLVGIWAIRRQALQEERHLGDAFPKDFGLYRNAVRRWL